MGSRTIELGRAVLASQTTNLELWLTTLITFSPQQDGVNLQQLGSNAFIEYISSGDVWVDRACGMLINFDINLKGEPLQSGQLRQLGNSIVNAPGWKQLGLRPSLHQDERATIEKLCLNLDYLRSEVNTSTIADMRPPEKFPTALLQSIEFAMGIHEVKGRAAPACKRAKQGRTSSDPMPNGDGFAGFDIDSEEDILMEQHNSNSISKPRKRRRPDRVSWQMSATKTSPSSALFTNSVSGETPHLSDMEQIEILTDATLRLAICNNLRGFGSMVKIKASTFSSSLADVAPALWRPGYRSMISHAAQFAPTLVRSLERVGSAATSKALQAKTVKFMTAPLPCRLSSDPPDQELVDHMETFTINRIWIHIQKSHLSRPFSGQVQTLCVPRFQGACAIDLDDILEEHQVTTEPKSLPEFQVRQSYLKEQSHVIYKQHDSLTGNQSPKIEAVCNQSFDTSDAQVHFLDRRHSSLASDTHINTSHTQGNDDEDMLFDDEKLLDHVSRTTHNNHNDSVDEKGYCNAQPTIEADEDALLIF